MDSRILDDYGLEGHDELCNELDEIRQDYFSTSNTGMEMPEHDSTSDTEEAEGNFHDTVEEDNENDSSNNSETNDNDDFSSLIKTFLERTCCCLYGKNQGPCSGYFNFEQLFEHRIQCTELSSAELDLVVLCALAGHIGFSSGKKRCWMNYFFRGQNICNTMFMFTFCIGERRLKNLKSHFKMHGVAPRKHGNTSRLPHNVVSHETLNCVVTLCGSRKYPYPHHGWSLVTPPPPRNFQNF